MSQRDGMTVRHRHVNVRDPEAMVNRRGVGGGEGTMITTKHGRQRLRGNACREWTDLQGTKGI
jgi:hypothetical protein